MIHKLLEDIKPKRKVLILTHNNPDPDTLAAAYGLKMLLARVLKKRVTIASHGIIGRAENRELVKSCNIEIYPSIKLNFSRYDYLIVVDTQPTAGNVYIPHNYFPHAVIDHHNMRNPSTRCSFHDLRPGYGSTSTIICEYYHDLNIIPDLNVATALYYGIKTDTIGTARGNTPDDLAMMSYIFPHISLKKLSKIENPELPRYYFKNMKKAVEKSVIIDDIIICDLQEVRNADLIAETADYLLRMREIKCTFVMGLIDDVCYFSLRYKSARKQVGRIALAIVAKIGTGGGHMKSAGGQVPLNGRTYEETKAILKARLLKRLTPKTLEEKPI